VTRSAAAAGAVTVNRQPGADGDGSDIDAPTIAAMPPDAPTGPPPQSDDEAGAATVAIAPGEIEAPAKSSKTGLIIGVLAALAIAGGVAVVSLSGGEAEAPTPATEAAAAPDKAPAQAVPTAAEEAAADKAAAAEKAQVAEKAAATPPEPAKAIVALNRQPADALVTIDGVAVIGDKHTLTPGRHELEASAPDHKTLKMTLQVAPGESQIPIRLQKAPQAAPPPTHHRPAHKVRRHVKKVVKPPPKPAPKPPPKPTPKKPDNEMLFD